MITINGELYSSKNSKQIAYRGGRAVLLSSKAVQKAKEPLLWELKLKQRTWHDMAKGKEYPLRVGFMIYRRTKGRFDYINMIQHLCDCMVEMEYLPDDNANYLIPVFLPYEVDPKNPRVEITIL